MELVKILKALADENRLRILNLLRQKELCVCELENLLGINQSNASRHLAKLKEAGLITYEKQTQFVFYRVNPKLVEDFPFLKQLLTVEMDRLTAFQTDLEKLRKLQGEGMLCERGCCCSKS